MPNFVFKSNFKYISANKIGYLQSKDSYVQLRDPMCDLNESFDVCLAKSDAVVDVNMF